MKVPCLEIDGLVLTQSVAIMEYLADRWLSRLIIIIIILMTMLMLMMLLLVYGLDWIGCISGQDEV